MGVFGLIGYFLESKRVPLGPMILGLILGPMLEENLRVGLIKSSGDWTPFLTRPICVGLILVLLLAMIVPRFLKRFLRASVHSVHSNTP
jgi:putative tricarboxylic transport membrane protein